MTVAELIAVLQEIEDKSIEVSIDSPEFAGEIQEVILHEDNMKPGKFFVILSSGY